MDISEAKSKKKELEAMVSELLKDFEIHTSLAPSQIRFVRQSTHDSLGNETEFRYAVNLEVKI